MDKAQMLIDALGGPDNIDEVEPCITRIRVVVKDTDSVSEANLKEAGAFGVVMQQNRVVQVVIGPEAEVLAEQMM